MAHGFAIAPIRSEPRTRGWRSFPSVSISLFCFLSKRRCCDSPPPVWFQALFTTTDRQYRSLLTSDPCAKAFRLGLTSSRGDDGSHAPSSLWKTSYDCLRLGRCCALRFIWNPQLSAPSTVTGGSDRMGGGTVRGWNVYWKK